MATTIASELKALLRRRKDGMKERLAFRMKVSVRTIERWASGESKPRWRDERRLRQIIESYNEEQNNDA
jgi:DNA-binding transcriptional regulator YiaG